MTIFLRERSHDLFNHVTCIDVLINHLEKYMRMYIANQKDVSYQLNFNNKNPPNNLLPPQQY